MTWNRVREIRRSRRMTQMQLAELALLPQSVISDVENHIHEPLTDTALRIAAALNSPIEDLFFLKRD